MMLRGVRFHLSCCAAMAIAAILTTGQVHAQPPSGAGKILRPKMGFPKRLPPTDKQARRIAEIERFEKMPPEQRRKALDRLDPERRQRIEQGLAQFRGMDPANRERLRNFENMPPEQRDSIRQNFRRMQELPQPRRALVRRELLQLRNLPPEERETRMQSEGFRNRFDAGEQSLIRETVLNFPLPE